MEQLAARVANHALSRATQQRDLARNIDTSMLLASRSELSRLTTFLKTQPNQVTCGLINLAVDKAADNVKTLSPTLIVNAAEETFILRLNNIASTNTPRGLGEESIALTYLASSPQWVAEQLESSSTEAYLSIFPQADYNLPAPCVSRVSQHSGSQEHLEVVLCAHPQLRPKANAIKTVPKTATLISDPEGKFLGILRTDGTSDVFVLKTPDAIDADLKRIVVSSDNFETFRTAVTLAAKQVQV